MWRQRDGEPALDTGALVGLCGRCWVEVLATDHPVPQTPAGHSLQNRTLQAGAGEDLAEGSTGSVMDHLNWGYLQLGLVALVFGGLQVWWIGSTIRKRDLARPLSEGKFRKSLERIWAKGS